MEFRTKMYDELEFSYRKNIVSNNKPTDWSNGTSMKVEFEWKYNLDRSKNKRRM